MASHVGTGEAPSGDWPVVLRGGDGRARVRPWWSDPHVAHLTFIDHGVVPSSTSVRVWMSDLRHRGFTAVRTGAVTDAGADVLTRQGFEVAETLRLLDLSLIGWVPPDRRTNGTRRLKLRERSAAATVDRAAFGSTWAMDRMGIDETCEATPAHRARAINSDPATARAPIAGFAITGRAARTGYLQRLAVHPDWQGHGFGFSLALDSVTWMRRRRLTRAVVNTATDNTVALDLYGRIGFRVLPQGLAVLTRRLDDI